MAAERRGFALIMVVITLGVMAILATVILANSANASTRYKIQSASSALLRFKSEIGAKGSPKPSFISDLTANPSRLSHLYVKLNNQDLNSCDQAYGNNDINNWRGPYHLVPMVRDSGYQIEPGLVVDDTLTRIPVTGNQNQNATLALTMRNVAIDIAQGIGLALDGVSTGAGPSIIFTPNGSNPVTVYYYIAIKGC